MSRTDFLIPSPTYITYSNHSIPPYNWPSFRSTNCLGGKNGVRLDSSLTLHTQIIRNSVKSTWNIPRNWAVLTISTVFRMIQIIISSWTYSNSYLSCLPAPTIACFHSALNILSIQSDPVKRYIKWCYSSAQSLTASLLPHTFHYQQEPCFLKWPTRPYIMWDSVNLLALSPTLVLFTHNVAVTVASPPFFLKPARCSWALEPLHLLVLLPEQYFLYISARRAPSPSSFLCSNVTPLMRTTLLTL